MQLYPSSSWTEWGCTHFCAPALDWQTGLTLLKNCSTLKLLRANLESSIGGFVYYVEHTGLGTREFGLESGRTKSSSSRTSELLLWW